MGAEQQNRDHALLSASGAYRWINCPPSARLEEQRNISIKSIYAEEGTLAHSLAELRLGIFLGNVDIKEQEYWFTSNNKSQFLDDWQKRTDFINEVDKYTNYVKESYLEALKGNKGTVLLIEQRFDFSHIVEKGFGTGDACIISDGVMEIIDLKFGKGIKVEAMENPQLSLYGLGALRKFDTSYDIHTVKLTIVQPRLDHISSWSLSVDDLIKWGETIVRPAANLAYKGEGEQCVGEWCKFCKVKALCSAFAEENMKLTKHEFKTPKLLDESDLLQIHEQLPMLVDWAKSIGDYLLEEALKGKQWPGLKIVEGRSLRKWVSEEKVIETLKPKFSPDKYLITSLAGIPAIEKLVGKKDFSGLLGDLVIIPPGKPTLVHESDKRPAMGLDQAKRDFKEEISEEY